MRCVIAFWFRYVLLFLFYACTLLCTSLLTCAEQWLQKILLTGAKIFMGPIESQTQQKKRNRVVCRPDWCLCMCNVHWLVGWLSLLQSQCFCTFFSLCCRGQKPTIIRFIGENVRKWTLIHCSRRCMCDCSFFMVVVVVCIVSYMYMSCLHLVWWCRFLKLQFCSLQFRLCAVRVQHKVSNWTNALIYCDPFWIVSWVFNRYRYSANLFGVKISFSYSPLYLSLRSIGSFVRFYFCFAFWITFEKKGIKKVRKMFDNLNNSSGLPPMVVVWSCWRQRV